MPIRKLLMGMAWPAILSMTINAMYNVVDSIFVSRLSEDALTAVSFVNPIQMMIVALSVGSGVGINSLIARRLGAKNQQVADKAASTSIRIGLFNYLIFLVIGVFFTQMFISGYAEKGTYIYEAACQYMAIVCIGSLFTNIEIVLEKVLQSTGNMVAPMLCSLTGAIVNVILDPILIFGLLGAPKLGVAGAALATVIGQLCAMLVAMTIVLKGEHLVKIQIRGFRMDWKVVADIYKVGFPSIVMQSIGSFMIIFYNMILVAYSTTAVAVLGIYFRIQSFVFMPVFGLNQGAMPIMGYNYGARNKDRLMQTYKEALKVAVIVMAAGTADPRTVALDIRRVRRNAQYGYTGSETYKHMFPAGGFRYRNGNSVPGHGTRNAQPLRFAHKTACRHTAAGVYPHQDRRRHPFVACFPAGRNTRSNVQRRYVQVAL